MQFNSVGKNVLTNELRKAERADINLDTGEWRYIMTKTNTPHIVPLCRQAVEILHELQPLTGRGRFVFPDARSNGRPMSENAVLAGLRRLGILKEEMSRHGFRAMARTQLDEVLGFRPDYIEYRLAHAVCDPNGCAYSRTAHLPERRKMMQAWADYPDQLKVEAPNGCGSRDAASAGRTCSGMEAACRARRWASANIGAPERLSDVHLTLKLRLLTLRLYLSSRQKEKGGTNHHEKNDLRRRGFVYGIFRSMLGRRSTGLPVERLLWQV